MKLTEFASIVQQEVQSDYVAQGYTLALHIRNTLTHVHIGKKYARVDVGDSGRYMVEIETGRIFGIKAYGVIHRGHQYGTLDTVGEWYWGGYKAIRRDAKMPSHVCLLSDKGDVVVKLTVTN